MSDRYRKLRAKFDKFNTLNALIDEGGVVAVAARKEKQRLSCTHMKKYPKSPGKLWKRKDSKPGACLTMQFI